MLARRYLISGDVQGVGFRYFVLREAQRIGNIRGYVRNLRDGRVETYAEAEEKELIELENALRKGPLSSEVSRVEIQEENPDHKHSDFRITF
jgi:acylphosphatase